jgi:hypothetical protein
MITDLTIEGVCKNLNVVKVIKDIIMIMMREGKGIKVKICGIVKLFNFLNRKTNVSHANQHSSVRFPSLYPPMSNVHGVCHQR